MDAPHPPRLRDPRALARLSRIMGHAKTPLNILKMSKSAIQGGYDNLADEVKKLRPAAQLGQGRRVLTILGDWGWGWGVCTV